MNDMSLRYILLYVLMLSVIAPARGQSSAGSSIVSRTVLSGDGLKAAEHRVYDNGLGVVPSYLLVPYSIDKDNLDLLVETGNYEWDADHQYLVSTLG